MGGAYEGSPEAAAVTERFFDFVTAGIFLLLKSPRKGRLLAAFDPSRRRAAQAARANDGPGPPGPSASRDGDPSPGVLPSRRGDQSGARPRSGHENRSGPVDFFAAPSGTDPTCTEVRQHEKRGQQGSRQPAPRASSLPEPPRWPPPRGSSPPEASRQPPPRVSSLPEPLDSLGEATWRPLPAVTRSTRRRAAVATASAPACPRCCPTRSPCAPRRRSPAGTSSPAAPRGAPPPPSR